MTIAFLDVGYQDSGARAACVLADSWTAQAPLGSYTQDIASVAAYEPGEFYRRELPCLLSVLSLLPAPADIIVIDGYVWLSPAGRAGLGAYLFEALGCVTPVVGVAKSAFADVESCPEVVPILRGISRNPLYVTATGIDKNEAAAQVRNMIGKHRIPDLLRMTDQLSRTFP